MKIELREDRVLIEGYVNSVERLSKPLRSRIGYFLERIKAGCFKRAIERNPDIKILLNHDWSRELGSTQSNLVLEEDSIGLHALAEITDKDVIEKARNGELVGWSFGFRDIDVDEATERGMPVRDVKDINLYEVSILDRTKIPAYDGTLIMSRDQDGDMQVRDEVPENEWAKLADTIAGVVYEKLKPVEQETVKIDYSVYDNALKNMKGQTK